MHPINNPVCQILPAHQSSAPHKVISQVEEEKSVTGKFILKIHSTCQSYANVQYHCPCCNDPCLLKDLGRHLEEKHSVLVTNQSTNDLTTTNDNTIHMKVPDMCETFVCTNCSSTMCLSRVQMYSLTVLRQTVKCNCSACGFWNDLVATNDSSDGTKMPEMSENCVCPKCNSNIYFTKAQIFALTVLQQTAKCNCTGCGAWHDLPAVRTMGKFVTKRNRGGPKRKLSTEITGTD